MIEPTGDAVRRHLTATGFVVWQGAVLLHWHRKERAWFPPGGHLEPNEDPVACVLREIQEESNVRAEVVATSRQLTFGRPDQLPPPVTILVEHVGGDQDPHQHIDLIYYCRPVEQIPSRFEDASMRWFDRDELMANRGALPPGSNVATPVPEDVRWLALDAIDRLCGSDGEADDGPD